MQTPPRDEIEAFCPDKILTMGGTAAHALSAARIEEPFLRSIHPSYYGRKGWYLEGASQTYDDSPEAHLEAKAHYYCRKIFGQDLPADEGLGS